MYIQLNFPFHRSILYSNLDISLTEDHQWLRWAQNKTLREWGFSPICFHVDLSLKLFLLLHTQHCKHTKVYQARSIPRKIQPCRQSLMVMQESLRKRLVGLIVESWGWPISKARPYLELVPHWQPTFPAGPTSTTTVLYVDSVPPQRERPCLDLFWT